jgi:hypothetical protein
LDAVENRLKPFSFLTCFSGLRGEEASSLSIVKAREGLQSRGILLAASMANRVNQFCEKARLADASHSRFA